jgi:uncharacterized protein (DUF1330 family)
MQILVTIDLVKADLALFEAYQTKALDLLPRHGAELVLRVRSLDGLSETHLMRFPDAAAFEAYRYDPERIAEAEAWTLCRARAAFTEVADVAPPASR